MLQLGPNGDYGDLIGWSRSMDYYANPDKWFGRTRNPYMLTYSEFVSLSRNTWSGGHAELYPVSANVKTDLSITVENDGFVEGFEEEEWPRLPELNIETNRPEDLRDYKIEFFSVNGDNKVSLGDQPPYTAGDYIVEVSLDQAGTPEFDSDGQLIKKAYSKASASATFTIRPDSKIVSHPVGNLLTYNRSYE